MINNKSFRIEIIPVRPKFHFVEGDRSWDLANICIWSACGFFLGNSTFYSNTKVCKPGYDYELTDDGKVISERPWFQWHYSPSDFTLVQCIDQMESLFDDFFKEQLYNNTILLPLSGGLDSRTLAASLLGKTGKVKSFSYEYRNAMIKETKIGEQLAHAGGFDFEKYLIASGYLWDKLPLMSKINGCYCEFTHARPLAVIDEVARMGDVFYLGHGGNLFDSSLDYLGLNEEQQIQNIKRRIVKKGGIELAEALWTAWNLPGRFQEFFHEEVKRYLREIKVDHSPSRLRIFKASQWYPRWTAVNLQLFEYYKQTALPYFSAPFLQFLCRIPDHLLIGRQIHIEYIKRVAPSMASIPWEPYAPYSLYTYKKYHSISDFPRRIYKRLIGKVNQLINRDQVTMNWQIQFGGKDNLVRLHDSLTTCKEFNSLVPKELTIDFFNRFKDNDARTYFHSVSMLLTLNSLLRYNES